MVEKELKVKKKGEMKMIGEMKMREIKGRGRFREWGIIWENKKKVKDGNKK